MIQSYCGKCSPASCCLLNADIGNGNNRDVMFDDVSLLINFSNMEVVVNLLKEEINWQLMDFYLRSKANESQVSTVKSDVNVKICTASKEWITFRL